MNHALSGDGDRLRAVGLSDPLTLPCGVRLGNRIAKAAMSEQLASRHHDPTPSLVRLYERWGSSGAGLLITGNVMVDRRAVSEPRQVVVDATADRGAFQAWSRAARVDGAHVWMQLNHAGRQVPRLLDGAPSGPSAVRVKGLAGAFATPRQMTESDIRLVVDRFADGALAAVTAGFTGIQIHAAHGYLLSQFLSPATNQRQDKWGGDSARRRRLLVEVVQAVRDRIGPAFPLSVKLNSADFQRGGIGHVEAAETALSLDGLGVDLLEISGGTFESTAMTGTEGTGVPGRRREREAYFWDFAVAVRRQTAMPLMLTGGFRTAAGMQDAVSSGIVDVIGLARPFVLVPALPAALIAGTADSAGHVEPAVPWPFSRTSMLAGMAHVAWHTEQLRRLAEGAQPRHGEAVSSAVMRYGARQLLHAAQRRLARTPASSATASGEAITDHVPASTITSRKRKRRNGSR